MNKGRNSTKKADNGTVTDIKFQQEIWISIFKIGIQRILTMILNAKSASTVSENV